MLDPKQKAKELYEEFSEIIPPIILSEDRHCILQGRDCKTATQCALIAVTNEYNSLREQLFNLRSCKVIESEKIYLVRLGELFKQEKEVKEEILKLE